MSHAYGFPYVSLFGDLGGHIGHHQSIGVLLCVERAGSVAVEVEGAQPHGPDVEREPEHCPHARSDRRAGEGEPSGVG